MHGNKIKLFQKEERIVTEFVIYTKGIKGTNN